MGMRSGSKSRGLTFATGIAVLFALLLAALAVPAPSSAAIRKGFVRHQEANWVWYGPESWFASSGPNDINIASPTGTLWLKFGAGGAVCPNSAAEWFRDFRDNYRSTAGQGFGLYSKPLRGARFTSTGRIQQSQSAQFPVYYRQKTKWAGRKRNGQRIRGELTMDVFANNFGTCGQQFLSIGAPARRNGRSIGLLKDVFSTLASQSI